ncbi:6-phosphogluconate dehydrogenase, decarboxylating, related [Neospora caninum Liverpool]|uniref:phosphogluconate dehydrogenase (NADP(+)-dependent, decarboxylating) n=1 Tax=Neospora caninum (strain Liverpool) TaxID=572307 RepID=F0VE28_NEOCL|nr:6-phosphogluconate dehydrogenase, decarboxylating, related [Neospora caninum Liverpool]CBZ51971.1 6-phosphogluconate dehydrogenase, decarboxylating, related [Neospora caninum Liverpool]|eukprot:XP_003882004.1 6-phosphogluconate dehydrogenase, decarboxylating, related [Neospora caninum Liverpool]
MSCDVGIYGLAVMGLGLSLNLASRGIRVSVCNRTSTKIDVALKRAKEENLGESIYGARTLNDFVDSLKTPRRIIMVIEAGAPVDALINHLLPKLDRGDCLVDAGNEFFELSEKREQRCASKGVLFMDVGLCAGEEGARSGPPLTPGGSQEAWSLMEPIFVQLAGKIDSSKNIPPPGALTVNDGERQNACVTHLGPCGAGHYVKMVHNGIMYGDMQLIAEAHQLLKYGFGLSNEELHDTYKKWNEGELHSYLIGITASIVRKKDSFTGAGCVIECDFLKVMQHAFLKNPNLENILLSEEISGTIQRYLPALQEVISLSLGKGTSHRDAPSVKTTLPLPAHSASYNYLASSCGLRLSMNLVQAQRDCFGAHHFKRTDREGKYHVDDWEA